MAETHQVATTQSNSVGPRATSSLRFRANCARAASRTLGDLAAGLREATRFYDLRHSYAAMLIDEGAHPRQSWNAPAAAQSKSPSAGIYGHVFPSLEASLIEALDVVYRSATPAQRAVPASSFSEHP